MASFQSMKPLQQTHFQLFYGTLNTFQFYLPYDPAAVTKHSLIVQANARVAANSEDTILSRNDVNTGRSAGLPSFTDRSKNDRERDRIGTTEPIERRFILKDRYAKSKLNSKITKEVRSTKNVSTLEQKEKRSKQSKFPSFTERSKNDGERDRIGTTEPTERIFILKDRYAKSKLTSKITKEVRSTKNVGTLEQKEKRSKKSKADAPGATLRVGLDMCSKRGDIGGAIKLYDLARKEGVKMGQYHYAVLLYLCSSAATGTVHPAKSGSSGRSLSSSDLFRENSGVGSDSLSEFGKNLSLGDLEEDMSNSFSDSMDILCGQTLDGLVESMKKSSNSRTGENKGCGIQVSEDMRVVALQKGFEIYDGMRLEGVEMNEATFTSVARMAMALGDGDMAFQIVKQMKEHGVNPRLRSYGPALAIFCSNGDVKNAFKVEKHMLENGVYPEEPELEALLKVSIEAGESDKVYYVLHKLRTSVRQVCPSTADLIEKWFRSKVASRVGKRKWDRELIIRAMENGGGGWHGKGWLGRGEWKIARTSVGSDGVCKCCGVRLVTIDLDPAETENFAQSVASIAAERERNLNFQKFQKWLEYYGPFEAVVDAANIGLYSQRKFKPSKVNAVVNGIRQMLPSRKWPLVVLHNRRITGEKMDEPFNRALIDKWRNADALYATPTGSNDDWYWLYAAIKCRSLIVTNDEMRDHLFQLLGNDFFPKWKERHQVHFSFTETGPTFRIPPPCSVVIQESEDGHWHVPIASEVENEDERIWLCCSRGNSSSTDQDSADFRKESQRKKRETRNRVEPILGRPNKHECSQQLEELSSNATTELTHHASILRRLEDAERHGACLIDFQI